MRKLVLVRKRKRSRKGKIPEKSKHCGVLKGQLLIILNKSINKFPPVIKIKASKRRMSRKKLIMKPRKLLRRKTSNLHQKNKKDQVLSLPKIRKILKIV